MKLVCSGYDLADSVSKVFKAVSPRTTNPILEGIKLSAYKNTLTLTATDNELSIECTIVADVRLEGETVVPGKFFSEFIKKLNKEQIELSLGQGNRLSICYASSEGVLQCLSSSDYPEIKELTDAQSFFVKKEDFKDLVNKVSFCVSTDDSRPMLKGVLLEITEEGITGVALDGYRLVKCSKPIQSTTALMSAVVPARCINEIARLASDGDESLEISIQKNYLMANLGHTKIVTRLFDGDFVNYRQIIPSNHETSVTIPKELFEAALERAVLLARSDRNNLVRFDISENIMLVSSNSDIGNVKENIPVKLTGGEISIAFNARYFSEILNHVECDNIMLTFIGSTSPCTVVPSGNLEDFMYLVLPVRLTD